VNSGTRLATTCDPGRTFDVSQSETDELNFRAALETLPLKKPEAVELHKD